jgi:hypothetical protein
MTPKLARSVIVGRYAESNEVAAGTFVVPFNDLKQGEKEAILMTAATEEQLKKHAGR